jgi:hypothetical protein
MSDFESAHFNEEDDNEEDRSENFEDWVENEDDLIAVRSLFCDTVFPSIEGLIDHHRSVYGFDLLEIISETCVDEQDIIMLVNFIRNRTTVAQPRGDLQSYVIELKERIACKEFRDPNLFMAPACEDDPMLFLLHDCLIRVDPARFNFLSADDLEDIDIHGAAAVDIPFSTNALNSELLQLVNEHAALNGGSDV